MTVHETLVCEQDGRETRLTCSGCGRPICPLCMIQTDVGLRCETCAQPPEGKAGGRARRTRAIAALIALAGLAVVGAAVAVATRPASDAPRTAEPAEGRWQALAALREVRGSGALLAMPDGTVIAAGGGVGQVPVGATEILDAGASTWRGGPQLGTARRGHAGVVLSDGSILVIGGIADGELLRSVERLTPSATSWSEVAATAEPRLGHTATLLGNGGVLVAGGTGESGPASEGGQTVHPVASAELFDPVAGTWQQLSPMTEARFEHTATRLPDGRVLLAGGLGVVGGAVGPSRTAELFDPATGTFTRLAPMATARTNHAAVALGDGRVMVVGGDDQRATLGSVEVFDPETASWSRLPTLRQDRRGHTATLLGDGSVLVAGGESLVGGSRTSLVQAERYHPGSKAWVGAGRMTCPRSEHGAVLRRDGSVVVAAGDGAFPGRPPVAQACVDVYRPDAAV